MKTLVPSRRRKGVYLLLLSLIAASIPLLPGKAAAPTSGQTLYLKFDETSGTVASDSSGSGNTGTVNGPVWTAGGKVNGALSFDGVNDYVSLANQTLPASFTITAWINHSGGPGNRDIVSINNRTFFIEDNVLSFWNNGSTGSGEFQTIPTGSWQHIAFTYSGTTLRAYLNGAPFPTTLTSTISTGGALRIGSNSFGGNYFLGSIDELRMYNRGLTDQEILEVYNDILPPPPDPIHPTVSVTAPLNNAVVSGTAVTVSASASDNVGVTGVQFLLDGATLGAEDVTSPYSIAWNTTGASNGTHTLSARARDAAGNSTTSAVVTVTVDNQAPAGSVVINGGASHTNNRNTTLTLSATDAQSPITHMRFSNTGSSFSAQEAYAETKAWLLSSGSGTKTVYAQFRDAAGTWSASFTDTIVLDTALPTVSAVAASNITNSSATITWTTNEPATSRVEYGPTVSYGSTTATDPALVTSHVVQLSGLSGPTTYNFRVISADAAGNTRTGTNSTFLTLPGDDAVAPSIPTNLNAVAVSPTQVNLTWVASTDNVGVAGYRILRGGVQIATSAVNSYSNTGLSRATAYTYTVAAYDAAGNVSGQSGSAGVTTPAMTIANVASSNVTPTSATITWTTDVPATSAVEYGATTSYGFVTAENPALVTNHSVNVPGLSSNTLYHYAPRSRDAGGNLGPQQDRVFTTLPSGVTGTFVNESVIANLNMPVAMEFLPDGRMLILEIGGTIKILQPGASQTDPVPFLQLANVGMDISGLYNMVLDPDFLTNRYYYIFYTQGSPGRDRLSRFTANAAMTETVPGSEFVIYQDPVAAAGDHHGGGLFFGNDGKLYLTTGEHFNVNSESQDLTNGRGKILRYNSDGTIPADNPFHDGPGPNFDAVWALGLRNPFQAFIDRPTGRIYIGDVGGNAWTTAIEEINLGAAGANYGWATCEGYSCGANPLFTSPIYAYSHIVNGVPRDSAVTGGFVYRGTQFPSAYVGSYFFADYTQNWIKRLTFDANGNVNGVFNFEPADGAVDGPYGDIVDLSQGPDGALYYVDLGYSDVLGNTDGIAEIRRIRFISGNQPPTVVASATPVAGVPPLQVAFSSAGSSDPESEPLGYLWNFGDGATSTAPNPSHVYQTTGRFTAQLSVSDGTNTINSQPINITVGNRPTAAIATPTNGAFFVGGEVISFSGDGADLEDGTLPASAFSWQIDFLHSTHVHPTATIHGSRSGTYQISTSGHDFSGETRYRITLTVTDSDGLQTSQSVIIYPTKVNLTFDTVPSGLTLHIDSIARVAPFVLDTLVGFTHTIQAPNQTAGQSNHTFVSWSDGGAQQHLITVPQVDASYTATYSVAQNSYLVAAWNFDEGAGTVLGDSSGNGNNGTVNGAAWVAGKYGQALSFNGLSNYVVVPDSNSLDLTSAFTIEAWIRPSGTMNGWIDAVRKGLTEEYVLFANSWGGPAGSARTATVQETAISGTNLAPDVWTHIATTYDGANVKIYVNGVLKATEPLSGSVTVSANPLFIGGNSNGEHFSGLIDNVRIYSRALTEAEIQANMAAPLQ